MAYKGFFRPIHPEKYKGSVREIVYRSRWELQFMMKLDAMPSVLEWSSEETVIPYPDPFKLGKFRRYFVDFKVKVKTKDGIVTRLIEIKPFHETQPPKKSKTSKGQITKPMQTFIINQAKWKAAKAFCEKRDWTFSVVTEKEMPSFVAK